MIEHPDFQDMCISGYYRVGTSLQLDLGAKNPSARMNIEQGVPKIHNCDIFAKTNLYEQCLFGDNSIHDLYEQSCIQMNIVDRVF